MFRRPFVASPQASACLEIPGRMTGAPTPEIAAGTMGYDEASGHVLLVQQDSSACNRTACRTTTWTWDSTAWAQVPVEGGPVLPLTRSGAFEMPMAFDEARGVIVLFASAS